jgi:ribosomal protein L37AE/L43A
LDWPIEYSEGGTKVGKIIAFNQSQPRAELPKQPCYCCTRCDSERFTLLESGLVKCAQCGAVMGNLGIIPIELSKRG